MNRLFRPAKRVKIFQDIVTQIQDAILSGRIELGQRLPSERNLQKIFQASRPTVREAMRVIENQGLIKINLGKNGGIFVKSKTFNPFLNTFSLLTRSHYFSLDNIAEFREQLESEMVQVAVNKSKEIDIDYLKKIIDEAKKYSMQKEKSIQKLIEVDTRFHIKLSMIAGNNLFTYILNSICNLDSYYKRFFEPQNDIIEENLQDLTDIFISFSNRQSNEAKNLLRHHIQKFNFNY